MGDVCTDGRFDLIERFKRDLVEATNIETSPEEMAVLDSILFRMWQMGWLDKLAASPWRRVEEELPEKEGDYLVWTMLYGGHAYTDYYTPKYGWDEYKVIAWMPLPEPPKEDA